VIGSGVGGIAEDSLLKPLVDSDTKAVRDPDADANCASKFASTRGQVVGWSFREG
jgi:hypothetical protein